VGTGDSCPGVKAAGAWS